MQRPSQKGRVDDKRATRDLWSFKMSWELKIRQLMVEAGVEKVDLMKDHDPGVVLPSYWIGGQEIDEDDIPAGTPAAKLADFINKNTAEIWNDLDSDFSIEAKKTAQNDFMEIRYSIYKRFLPKFERLFSRLGLDWEEDEVIDEEEGESWYKIFGPSDAISQFFEEVSGGDHHLARKKAAIPPVMEPEFWLGKRVVLYVPPHEPMEGEVVESDFNQDNRPMLSVKWSNGTYGSIQPVEEEWDFDIASQTLIFHQEHGFIKDRAARKAMTTQTINSTFNLSPNQIRAQEAPVAEPVAEDVVVDEGASVATQEITALFEATYDSSGPEGLAKLCYSGVDPETMAQMKDMIEKNPEDTIQAMVAALASDPKAVEAWMAYSGGQAEEAPQEEVEAESEEPKFEAGDTVESVNPYGMKTTSVVAGIVDGHYLMGYDMKPVPFKTLEASFQRIGEQPKAVVAESKVAIDQLATNYWGEYFKAYGAMLTRPLAFAKTARKTANGDMLEALAEKEEKTAQEGKFKVYDWAGNEMDWGTFPDFDSAWGAIMEKVPNEEDHGEYEVREAGLTAQEDEKDQTSVTASEKIAADNAAKAYWTEYFQAYGAKLVQDGLSLKKQARRKAIAQEGDDVTICNFCHEEVSNQGEDGISVCEGCGVVEGNTKTVSWDEFEKLMTASKSAQVVEKTDEWVQIAPNVLEVDYADGAHGAVVECGGKFTGTLVMADGTVHEIASEDGDGLEQQVDALHIQKSMGEAHEIHNAAGKAATQILREGTL
jgi:ribosomal protein L37AE/L43A